MTFNGLIKKGVFYHRKNFKIFYNRILVQHVSSVILYILSNDCKNVVVKRERLASWNVPQLTQALEPWAGLWFSHAPSMHLKSSSDVKAACPNLGPPFPARDSFFGPWPGAICPFLVLPASVPRTVVPSSGHYGWEGQKRAKPCSVEAIASPAPWGPRVALPRWWPGPRRTLDFLGAWCMKRAGVKVRGQERVAFSADALVQGLPAAPAAQWRREEALLRE